MLESAELGHQIIEHFFAGVAEGRVTQVVCQAYRFCKAFVQAKLLRDGPAYLCDFNAVRQAGAVVVVQAGSEDLRFAFEPAKGRAVDDAVAVTLEVRAVRVRLFGIFSAPAGFLSYCITAHSFTLLQARQFFFFAYFFQQAEQLGEALADDVCVGTDGHKISIAVPSRHDVDVQVAR
jgi:hypothetical protein